MIARVASLWDRFAAFIFAPAPPVLAPYQRLRSPLESKVKKTLLFSVLILLGAIYGFFFTLLPPSFLIYLLGPIAFLLLVVIWALPDRDTAPPVVAIERLFWVFWLTMILWPNYLALALPGLPWITVARLFGIPLLILMLVAVSVSKQFRADMKKPLNEVTPLWRMLVAFVCVQFLAVILAPMPASALNRAISFQIIWTNIFFVSAYVFVKPGRIARWCSIIAIMAVITALIGLVETSRQQVLWADHIPSFLKIEDPSVQKTLTAQFRGGEYRAVSTFAISLSFAEYLALATPFLIHIFVITRKQLVRFLCLAADVLVVIAIYHTHARLGMVGFLLAHAVYGLFWGMQRWRTNRQSIFGPALTLAYPALLAVFWLAVISIGRLRVMVLGGGLHEASNAGREAQFAAAPPVVMQSPLFGFGAGQGAGRLGMMNAGGEISLDSYVLSMLLDYGIAGFLLFVGMLFYGLYIAAEISTKTRDRELSYAIPVAICLMVFMTIKLVLSQEHNNPIMFMLLGMIAAMAYRSRLEKEAGGQGVQGAAR